MKPHWQRQSITKRCDGKRIQSEICKKKLSLPNLNIGQECQCSILSISSFPQIFKLNHRTSLHESIHIMSVFLSKNYFALFALSSSSGLQLHHRLSNETQFESLPWRFYPAMSQIPRWAIALDEQTARKQFYAGWLKLVILCWGSLKVEVGNSSLCEFTHA